MPFVDHAEATVHYLDEGSGPVVVWLPGGNDHAGLMLHAHRQFTTHYRWLFIDPRGQGRSSAPIDTHSYDPPGYVSDVLAVLDHLGIERAVVGGHSRGGRTAMEFALRHPQRVVAAIAAASPHLGATPGRTERFDAYETALRSQGVDGFLPLLRGAPRHPERRAEYEAYIRGAGPDALIAQYNALRRLTPLPPRLSELTVPALFLCGSEDELLPHSKAAAAAAPNARLVVVDGAGHAIFAGSPPAYYDTLAAFLGEVYAEPAGK